jgi:hypothetical protein
MHFCQTVFCGASGGYSVMFSIYYGILFFTLSSTIYKKKNISLKFLLSAFFSNKTMLVRTSSCWARSCLEYLPGDQEGLFKLVEQLRKFFNSVIYNTATGYVLLVYLTNI